MVAIAVYFTLDRFWFMDDAFIYLRYADNWVLHGLGLTYNAGEFVEGYTSPAWLFLLAFFRLLGANYWPLVLGIAIVSTVIFSFLAIWVNDALTPGQGVRINFPLAYLCANYGMSKYFSSALESPLVLLCAAGMALLVVRPKSRTGLLLTAVAPMVRHELVLAVACIAVHLWIRERKLPLRLVVLTTLPLLAWIVFRVYYYADFFPNTFHLKDTVRFDRGLIYLYDTCRAYNLHFVLLAFACVVMLTRHKTQLSERLAMILAAVAVGAYVVKVGGDYNHFRLLSLPFVLVVFSCGGIVETIFARAPRILYPLAIILPVTVVYFVSQFNLLAQPTSFGGVERAWRRRATRSLRPDNIRRADKWARQFGKGPQDRVFVDGWCLLGFRRSNEMMIHRFGLTDGILARLDNVESEYAGHRWGLVNPAVDLMWIQVHRFKRFRIEDRLEGERIHNRGRVGRIRHAAKTGRVANWIRRNLDSLEVIERKIYNRHQFWENLKLALVHPRVRYERGGGHNERSLYRH